MIIKTYNHKTENLSDIRHLRISIFFEESQDHLWWTFNHEATTISQEEADVPAAAPHEASRGRWSDPRDRGSLSGADGMNQEWSL